MVPDALAVDEEHGPAAPLRPPEDDVDRVTLEAEPQDVATGSRAAVVAVGASGGASLHDPPAAQVAHRASLAGLAPGAGRRVPRMAGGDGRLARARALGRVGAGVGVGVGSVGAGARVRSG